MRPCFPGLLLNKASEVGLQEEREELAFESEPPTQAGHGMLVVDTLPPSSAIALASLFALDRNSV